MNFAFPDVCLVPTPAGPIPTPFPNIALTPTAIPNQVKVLAMCMPTHNVMTVTPLSNGDNPGVAMGVASGMVMGPATAAMGSTNVLIGGPPVAKLAMPAKQNGLSPNTVGMTIAPSQIKVMALR
ncbi:DUF4150 domain-containing protein [Bosea caraganae]|nr:DUF4150 domain-containing protein [Bosea caraganae]